MLRALNLTDMVQLNERLVKLSKSDAWSTQEVSDIIDIACSYEKKDLELKSESFCQVWEALFSLKSGRKQCNKRKSVDFNTSENIFLAELLKKQLKLSEISHILGKSSKEVIEAATHILGEKLFEDNSWVDNTSSPNTMKIKKNDDKEMVTPKSKRYLRYKGSFRKKDVSPSRTKLTDVQEKLKFDSDNEAESDSMSGTSDFDTTESEADYPVSNYLSNNIVRRKQEYGVPTSITKFKTETEASTKAKNIILNNIKTEKQTKKNPRLVRQLDPFAPDYIPGNKRKNKPSKEIVIDLT